MGRPISVKKRRDRRRYGAVLDLTRLWVSYHEAAHAVVSLALGHPLDHVALVRKGRAWGGYTLSRHPDWYLALAESPTAAAGLTPEQHPDSTHCQRPGGAGPGHERILIEQGF